jgi:aspartyl-tRNA(Asn)/glutamyl-tRNA(Gln) amidotransferase subunit B
VRAGPCPPTPEYALLGRTTQRLLKVVLVPPTIPAPHGIRPSRPPTANTMEHMAKADLMDYDKALEMFEPVIGLEIHVELSTKTKMFSDAPNPANTENHDADPNTLITPVDLGLPGSLPVVNETAVEYAISLGLALGCEIATSSRFARKNYFYPDLAKNYQISQYDEPIAFEGTVEVELEDGSTVDIPIERAHMEEDAGKLTHLGGATGRIHGAEASLVDYNRAGVPLVEIVTKPIFVPEGVGAPEVAKAYVSTVRDIVRGLGISEARMERGNLRVDANVSLRLKGASKLGTRTETKNVNSMRSVERAVRHEIQRQAAILAAGGTIQQETRHWHEDKGTTSPGRVKSDADDYRYFPEPDLLPIEPPAELVASLRAALPEAPAVRRRRLRETWGFTELEFRDVANAGLLVEIEETVGFGAAPAQARKWWTGEIARLANAAGVDAASLVSPLHVSELIALVESGELTDRLARQVLEGVIAGEGRPSEVVAARGLAVVSDDGALLAAIDAALAEQPGVLEKLRDGKVQAAGAIIGAVMKAMGGSADAARVRELVLERAQG